jgi:hypothetical protein
MCHPLRNEKFSLCPANPGASFPVSCEFKPGMTVTELIHEADRRMVECQIGRNVRLFLAGTSIGTSRISIGVAR